VETRYHVVPPDEVIEAWLTGGLPLDEPLLQNHALLPSEWQRPGYGSLVAVPNAPVRLLPMDIGADAVLLGGAGAEQLAPMVVVLLLQVFVIVLILVTVCRSWVLV